MAQVLTEEIVNLIRTDKDLFHKVSVESDLMPSSLLTALYRNSQKLTQYSIVQIISKHTGKKASEILITRN